MINKMSISALQQHVIAIMLYGVQNDYINSNLVCDIAGVLLTTQSVTLPHFTLGSMVINSSFSRRKATLPRS